MSTVKKAQRGLRFGPRQGCGSGILSRRKFRAQDGVKVDSLIPKTKPGMTGPTMPKRPKKKILMKSGGKVKKAQMGCGVGRGAERKARRMALRAVR